MKKLLIIILGALFTLGTSLTQATEYSQELQDAYNRAYENGIITESSIDDATLYDTLPNPEMRAILLNFSKYLGLDSDLIAESFEDLFIDEGSYANRANFGTALSRILWGDIYNGGNPYYKKHLEALKTAGIINQIDNPEDKNEIKGYVLNTLKLSSDNYNSNSISCDDPIVKVACSKNSDECPKECKNETNTYSQELQESYNRAYENGIITSTSIDNAGMYDTITNMELAKILSIYTTEVLGYTPDTSKDCSFTDIDSVKGELHDYILKSCQLGLMPAENSNNFHPYNKVNRAIFGTALSRALWGEEHEGGSPYYKKHLEALKAAGIINQIDNPEDKNEIKGYVLNTLRLSSDNHNSNSISCDDPIVKVACSKNSDECPKECTTNTQCKGMDSAKVSHTIDNNTITLKWNIIEGNNVKISIYNPDQKKYVDLGTVKMSNKKFSYDTSWGGEQNFRLSNGCDDYYYKVNVSLDNEDPAKLDGKLVNNIKKTVEFKSYEASKKVVFSGIYTALNDTTINYYGIETKYDESRGNNYIDKRCKKNSTDMTFYVYIDGKMIDRTPQTNTCSLAQGAGFGKRIDEITLKKGESKNIKVEIEMSGSVKEEDIYNFELSLNKVDKNNHNFEKGKVKADFNIKILNNNKDSINLNIEKEKNQNNTEITTAKKIDGNPSDIVSNGYTREMNDAYQYAHENGITTTKNIEKAKMNSPLTRIAMAKMLSYYAINVLGQRPDTSKTIKFKDVTDKQNSDYDNAVTLSYQLGIMGQGTSKFRPNDEVTRAEFATALSRMLYGTEDGNGNTKYYEPHIAKLNSEGIINNTNPKIKEKRGYVMLMLMRSSK